MKTRTETTLCSVIGILGATFCLLLIAPNAFAATRLKILTFNVWDVGKANGEYSAERHEKICDRFREAYADKNNGWDIILIQEIWPWSRRHVYRNCGYPHMASIDTAANTFAGLRGKLIRLYTNGDGLDAGLRVLSRFPIMLPKRHTYSVNGSVRGLLSDGDLLANKSAMFVPVIHPRIGPILVFNTHLVSRNSSNNYNGQRRIQLQELARFVKKARDGEFPVILGGDFNIGPWHGSGTPDPLYVDELAWAKMIPVLFPGLKRAARQEFYCTYCPSLNRFASPDEADQNIDHLFVSKNVDVIETGLAFTDTTEILLSASADKPQKTLTVNYSDHFGYEATLSIAEHPARD